MLRTTGGLLAVLGIGIAWPACALRPGGRLVLLCVRECIARPTRLRHKGVTRATDTRLLLAGRDGVAATRGLWLPWLLAGRDQRVAWSTRGQRARNRLLAGPDRFPTRRGGLRTPRRLLWLILLWLKLLATRGLRPGKRLLVLMSRDKGIPRASIARWLVTRGWLLAGLLRVRLLESAWLWPGRQRRGSGYRGTRPTIGLVGAAGRSVRVARSTRRLRPGLRLRVVSVTGTTGKLRASIGLLAGPDRRLRASRRLLARRHIRLAGPDIGLLAEPKRGL